MNGVKKREKSEKDNVLLGTTNVRSSTAKAQKWKKAIKEKSP
jgi:hypothetical protein